MSADESTAFFFSYGLGIILWICWFWQIAFSAPRSRAGQARQKLVFAPFIAAGLLFLVLKLFSSFDVRDDPKYLWGYFFMGMAWTAIFIHVMSLFGVSARDHVLERKNEAAAWLLGGAVIGLCLCFAGGNIGDGPGWWVVVFAASLSTGTLLVLWWILARIGHAMISVVLDRDVASGIRAGSFFVAAGLILGRAVAGNWVSAEATLRDFFLMGWPAGLLLLLALKYEQKYRPTPSAPEQPMFSHGVVPAAQYLAGALAVLLALGSWK